MVPLLPLEHWPRCAVRTNGDSGGLANKPWPIVSIVFYHAGSFPSFFRISRCVLSHRKPKA